MVNLRFFIQSQRECPASVVAAHAALVETTELNFIGNIEGLDIPRGVADVVVTSGFVGNVVLKMLEGVSETVVRLARYAQASSRRSA